MSAIIFGLAAIAMLIDPEDAAGVFLMTLVALFFVRG